MSTDDEFISMGDNIWALRSRFPYGSVDEEVSHPEDEGNVPRRKYRKKVSVFIGDFDGDDTVDCDPNNPGDEDLNVDGNDSNEDDYLDDDPDDADDNELDDGIEGQLSELHQDDPDDGDD